MSLIKEGDEIKCHIEKIDRVRSRMSIHYLDIHIHTSKEGGGKRKLKYMKYERINYLYRIKNCGTKILTGSGLISTKCKKQACPKCGGINHSIHTSRIKAVEKRIEDKTFNYSRQLVFTLPLELRREHFMTREGLNRLFDIVRRNIEKYFGVLVKVKNKEKGKNVYRLDKHVMATLHLFGESHTYHPHINVMIFEETGSWDSLRIDSAKLTAIRKSYQKALSSLLKKSINQAVFNYQYTTDQEAVKREIRYVTKSFQPDFFEAIKLEEDFELMHLLTDELKQFHFVRFWGKLSNCKYKKQNEQRKAA